ncbi:MAG: hypothetical protein ABIP03_14285 [Aquihabitans sp.]
MNTLRRRILGMAAVMLVVGGATACEPPVEPEPTGPVRFADAPIAADQVNGVGYATLISGNLIYLGGSFTQVRDQSGVFKASRTNVAAFDRATGALVTTFQANTNGMVRAIRMDGGNLYLGGDFSSVNGVSRARIAAVDPLTGAVRSGWNASINSSVYSMAVGGGRLFAAGPFSTVNGVARSKVAAVSQANGAVDATFNPNVNNTVQAIAATADGSRVFIGGGYTSVHGTATTRLTALDGTTGAVTSPTFDASGVALDLEVTADGTRIGAALGDQANQGAVFSTSTGVRLMRQRCGGDAQAITFHGDNFFTGNHEECDRDYSIRLTSNSSITGARDLSWKPSFDRFWGVRDLDASGTTLAVAGDFTNVAGVAAQGIVIFKIQAPPTPGPVTMNMGSTWRYLDNGIGQPGWTDPAFDDSAWASGPGQLGYGDGDEATTVGFGPNANQKFITTWFRTGFTAAAVPGSLTLNLIADDGAIVYLNGVEVARDNMPAGPDTASLVSSTGRSGSAESQVRSFTIPPGLVVTGSNTIAVSIHQDWVGSSDISFDASLTSTP